MITIKKEKIADFIQLYINELEEQDIGYVEIVDMLLDFFSKVELEELGFAEFIDDYFQESHL